MLNNEQRETVRVAEAHPADRHLVDDLERSLDDAAPPRLARNAVPRELLAPASVRGLTRMTAEEWAMMISLWGAMAMAPRWLWPLLVLPLAGRFHALGVVLHDATHMPLRRKTAGVRAVEIFCGYPIASTLNAMRYHHIRHHRDSGMHTDPYFKSGDRGAWWWIRNTLLRGVVLVPFWSIRPLAGVVALVVPTLRNFYGRVFLQDKSGDDLRHSRELIDCARAELGQLAFLALVIAATVRWPLALTAGYLIPVVVAAVLAARRVLIEHNYERVSDRRVDTIIATTNDNHLGLLGAVMLAPRNIGYHIVHHIHPQARLESLPRLRAWYG
ncbi:MAG: fatty acid desaturase, partial [Gemmatimonadaceae bacterium]